jgi:flagellar biosynthesis/type III secretory pathway ATPase
VGGSNPDVDSAVERLPRIHAFLRQRTDEVSAWPETLHMLDEVAA